MRHFNLILLLLLAACQAVEHRSTLTASTPSAATPPTLVAPAASPPNPADPHPYLKPPEPVDPPQAEPLETIRPPTQPTHAPTGDASGQLAATGTPERFTVRFHPDDRLYVGDRISFEVIAPPDVDVEHATVTAEFPTADGEGRAEARFGKHGIGGRIQADMIWVWNTSGIAPGEQLVEFSVNPEGPTWRATVNLLPQDRLPPREAAAEWREATNDCCRVAFVTGTLAERDLEDLLESIDLQAERAAQRLGATLDDPLQIVLLPRVLGHGGFASNAIAVSYLERDYIGGDKDIILHHELVHILDGALGGELRPSMLVEGLAVYLSGGHYQAEPLLERAAALLPPEPGCAEWPKPPSADETAEGCGLDRFVTLETLADDFYFQQHEIGYLQSGALIEYMVETWGWEAYSAFYRDMRPPRPASGGRLLPEKRQSQAMEEALHRHFGLGLDELEQRFRAALQAEFVQPETAGALRLGLRFYDTARRYQQQLDPSAYFLTAWLLDIGEMRKRNLIADYYRHPSQPQNITLELMLIAADTHRIAGQYETADRLLDGIETVLDAIPQDGLQAFSVNPLAADYLALVLAALQMGHEPQRLDLLNDTARMQVGAPGSKMVELAFVRGPEGWMLQTVLGFQGVGQLHNTPLSELNGSWQYRFR